MKKRYLCYRKQTSDIDIKNRPVSGLRLQDCPVRDVLYYTWRIERAIRNSVLEALGEDFSCDICGLRGMSHAPQISAAIDHPEGVLI